MRGLEKNNQYDKPANFEAVLNKFKTTQASRNSMIDDLQAQNRAQQEKLKELEEQLKEASNQRDDPYLNRVSENQKLFLHFKAIQKVNLSLSPLIFIV